MEEPFPFAVDADSCISGVRRGHGQYSPLHLPASAKLRVSWYRYTTIDCGCHGASLLSVDKCSLVAHSRNNGLFLHKQFFPGNHRIPPSFYSLGAGLSDIYGNNIAKDICTESAETRL